MALIDITEIPHDFVSTDLRQKELTTTDVRSEKLQDKKRKKNTKKVNELPTRDATKANERERRQVTGERKRGGGVCPTRVSKRESNLFICHPQLAAERTTTTTAMARSR